MQAQITKRYANKYYLLLVVYGDCMAKPIEPTPILTGKDSESFWECIKNKKFDKNKELELAKGKVIYRLFSKQ